MESRKTGEILTFYSFKGGAGRTMALANIAVLTSKLANSVLMIDWDLEAPGLHKFFYKYITPEDYDTKLGLIDLFIHINKLLDDSQKNIKKEDLKHIITKLNLSNYIVQTSLEGIYLLKSGRLDNSYSERINKFSWVDLFYKYPDLFLVFSEYLKENYDYTFIDSRTGFTDTGGICTTLLPDKLCLVFTTNHQSLDGVIELTKKSLTYRTNSSDFRPLKIYPIPSRIELAEKDLRNLWRKGDEQENITGFQPIFESIFNDYYGINKCDLTAYFDTVQIHHEPKYSYGEQIAVLTESFSDNLSLTNVYRNLLQKIIIDPVIYVEKFENLNISNKLIRVYFYSSHSDYNYTRLLMDNISKKNKIFVMNDLWRTKNINDDIIQQINNIEVLVVIITSDFINSEFIKHEFNAIFNNYLTNETLMIMPVVIGLELRSIPAVFNKMVYMYYEDFEEYANNIENVANTLTASIMSSPSIKSRFTDNSSTSNKLNINQREREFIKFAVSELTYTEIADRMLVSPRTVDGYRESVFEKLNVKSRVGLVLEAIRKGLIEL